MRRISWIDQQIRNVVWSAGVAFFECWLSIGPMTDDGHHGEGKHDE